MILIVDMCMKKDSLSAAEFTLPIASMIRGKSDFLIRHYSKIDSKDIGRSEKIILSGTALKDNQFIKDIDMFSWIKTCKKPILGICAGMEAIALAFGSSLKQHKEIGMAEIRTKKKNPLFSGNFKAYELHSYAIEPSDDFDILAESKGCIQAIKHKRKEIYGLMFHPEVRNRDIVDSFVELV